MMADHKSVTRMLKTARGQIDGILRMVEEDRYCVDISTQLMATQALIARINADVLKAHIEGCVASAIESGDEELKAAKLAEITVNLSRRVVEGERLYGSVSAADIADEITQQGVKVTRAQIALAEPIKQLGVYPVSVKVFGDVSAEVKVWVVKAD